MSDSTRPPENHPKPNPWTGGLWTVAVLGAIGGAIMVAAGTSGTVNARYVEDAVGPSIAAALGGALLTASLVAVAIACVVSYLEWNRWNRR